MTKADGRRRVFFASFPEPSARAALVRWQHRVLDRCHARGLRPMAPAALHVTLLFLGERDAAEVEALRVRADDRLAAAAPPFRVRCGPLRLLPSTRRPRVLAAELDSAGALEALAAGARVVASAVGIQSDPRPFLPHLTLARLRPGPASLVAVPPPEPLAFGHVGLYESRLAASGARYRALWRAPLTG